MRLLGAALFVGAIGCTTADPTVTIPCPPGTPPEAEAWGYCEWTELFQSTDGIVQSTYRGDVCAPVPEDPFVWLHTARERFPELTIIGANCINYGDGHDRPF